MTPAEFNALDVGDIVRGKLSVHSYVVTANYGGRVTAVRTADLTNPPEWNLVKKADRLPCLHCDGAGEIETDNNGPIVPCPICQPPTKHPGQFDEKARSLIHGEPVAWLNRERCEAVHKVMMTTFRRNRGEWEPLYTAPPAPAVPDGWREVAEHLRHCRTCGETDIADCHEGAQLWNRAAAPEVPRG